MADIQSIGVIGAGQMGRGIAQVAAQTGLSVTLLDVDQATAENGIERIAKGLGRLVEKEKISADDRTAILKRIAPTGDYGRFAECGLVVEAATVGEAIAALEASHPGFGERILDEAGALRKFVNVFVSDDDVRFLDGLATPVPDGDTVAIVPAVAGG